MTYCIHFMYHANLIQLSNIEKPAFLCKSVYNTNRVIFFFSSRTITANDDFMPLIGTRILRKFLRKIKNSPIWTGRKWYKIATMHLIAIRKHIIRFAVVHAIMPTIRAYRTISSMRNTESFLGYSGYQNACYSRGYGKIDYLHP